MPYYLVAASLSHCPCVVWQPPPPLHQVLPSHIRNNLMVFVNCLVEDPTFDSQTKETLTLDNLTVEHATLPPAVVRKALTQTSLGDQILSLSK